MAFKCKYHRDGTVTHWDVYRQQQRRLPASKICDATLATLSESERARIAKIASETDPFDDMLTD